jgi:amidase
MRLALTSVLLGTTLLAACQPSTTTTSPQPRATKSPGTTAVPAFAFEEADIAGLQARMARNELTSHALTQAYLDRIAALDKAGPALNSIIELNPDALREADARDAERKAGKVRGPLHGIPVLLKDNIDATPMVNSGGSLALASHKPARDAFLVARLREAGAVILGKTNLSEWANFRSTHASSGWSGRGGQTKNPYVLDRNPCGSSAGTGTAIAANLAVVGVGSETDGSIICPASMTGLVGIKPTVGLVSRDGIIPISHSQDTAGPMARSVADAATLLAAMTGRDEADPATAGGFGRTAFDFAPHLRADGLKGKRIGVARQLAGMEPNADRALEQAIAVLKAQGAIVVDPIELPHVNDLGDAEFTVLLYEFRHDLEAYLQKSNAPVRTLAELIAFNKQHAAQEMPWFAQELFERAQAVGGMSDPKYLDAIKAKRLAGPEGIDVALKTHQLDAILAPTWGPAFPTDLLLGDHIVSGDPTIGGVSQLPSVSGYPSITVPAAMVHGLPVGIAFMGTAWSEPTLIEIAYAYEQASKARKPPQFLPTVDYALPAEAQRTKKKR